MNWDLVPIERLSVAAMAMDFERQATRICLCILSLQQFYSCEKTEL